MNRTAFIVAHSDDLELSCGGLLYKLNKKSLEFNLPIIIYTSDSAYRNYDGRWGRTLRQVKEETNKSLEIYGIKNWQIDVLHYPTKSVPYDSEIIERINRILDEMEIDTIITHNPDDSHLDHSNTAKSALTAGRRIPNFYTFEPIFPARSLSLFQPQMYIDISGEPYEAKIKSLMIHESQFKKYGKKWIDSVDSLSRLRGIQCNCERAECFTVIRQKLEI